MQSVKRELDPFEEAIGGLLLESGKLDERAWDRTVQLRSETGERLVRLLPKLGLVAERDIAEAIARHLGSSVVEAGDYPPMPLLESRLSVRFLKETRVLPISEDDDTIVLAMEDPSDQYAIDAVRLVANRKILSKVAVAGELEAAIER